MKDVVTVEINAPLAKVAALFADPTNSEKWMEDTRYAPLSGEQGALGSKYLLTQKKGELAFEVTVGARDLPKMVQLILESPAVKVRIAVTFHASGQAVTRLTSEEVFTFHGVMGKMFGLLGRRSIRSAHRRQMESFKRFAEKAGA